MDPKGEMLRVYFTTFPPPPLISNHIGITRSLLGLHELQ